MQVREEALQGVGGSSGFTQGPAAVFLVVDLDLRDVVTGPPEEELDRLRASLDIVAAELEERAAAAAGDLEQILEAQAMMVRDPGLLDTAAGTIEDHGFPASRAIMHAGERYASALEQGSSGYMRERAADIRDVCRRVALHLQGSEEGTLALREPSVIVARELSPADVASMDQRLILGFATERGSRTCHTAIVARSLKVPAVLAVRGLLDRVSEGDALALDGEDGIVYPGPSAELMEDLRGRYERRQQHREELIAALDGNPAATADGHRVELGANIGAGSEVAGALALGAEGVGLFRTELMFHARKTAPGVEEQAEAYRRIARSLNGGRLVIRTFDFGADKPVPFLDMPEEPNPALGVRGMRLGIEHPELLSNQLAAVAEVASEGHRIAVMAPMIGIVEEAEWFKEQANRAGCDEAGVEVGIMIEVPSGILLAEELCAIMDFVSIGTNDLIQYLHAADRQLGGLTHLQDHFSPAVLRAVDTIGRAATGRSCWVGVCGEAASDPAWAAAAVGLGVTELSMSGDPLVDVRAVLGRLTLERCREVASAALACGTAEEARRAAHELL